MALKSYRAKVTDSGVEGEGFWLDVEVRDGGKVLGTRRVYRHLSVLDEPGQPQVGAAMEEAIRFFHGDVRVKALKGREHGDRLTFKVKD